MPKGQKGSKIPIPSIERNYERFIYFKIWQKLLQGNQLIREQFPKYYSKNKRYLEKNFVFPDKNPQRLTKYYVGNIFNKWIEVYNERNSCFLNSIICFVNPNEIQEFGLIRVIEKCRSQVKIQKILLRKNDLSNLFNFTLSQQYSIVDFPNIIGFFSSIKFYNQEWLIPII